MRDNMLYGFPTGYDGTVILERLSEVLKSILDLGFVRSLELRSGMPASCCS